MLQTPSTSITQHTDQLRGQINEALSSYAQFDRDCPETLREAIRYSLLGAGKRLRPALVLMASEACGGEVTEAMPAACAVEMVHAYSLVHDDLPAMDDDDLRRGRPTCHKQFDEATAILAGDALLALAFQVLAENIQSPEIAAECCATLARAAGASALVGGQADDLAGEQGAGTPGATAGLPSSADGTPELLEALQQIHARKTGAMFVASLRLGGLSAGANTEQLEALEAFGRALGLAFQITDDLLDVRGDESALGKRVQKDSGRGKLTFPGLLGVEESSRRAEQLIDEAIQAVSLFGPAASNLEALARFVLERNR
jgi:geranylgeranyl diphosphate synthase type II